MGGFIAQSFICRYPEMAKAFVAIDSTPYGDYYSKSDIWWLSQIEWMSKLYPEKLLKSSIAKQNALTEIGRSNMAAMIEGYDKTELCHLMGVGYAGFLDDNRACEIPCPVLLLVGEKDNTGKVRAYNREWSRRTGFQLEWIPNAAHNSNVDSPQMVNEKITDFLWKINRNDSLLIRQASQDEMMTLWEYEDFDHASATAKFFYNNIASGNAQFWAVNHNDELIGELYVFRNLDDKDFADGTKTAYLCAFRVREDYRGRGIGSKLLEEVLLHIKADGFTRATIGVSPDEERNIKLYQRFGFREKVKDCYVDPCAMDENTQPKQDEGFWLLLKKL